VLLSSAIANAQTASDLLDLKQISTPQHVKEHLLKYSSDKFQRVELTEDAIKTGEL
jgi:hypothetical protein